MKYTKFTVLISFFFTYNNILCQSNSLDEIFGIQLKEKFKRINNNSNKIIEIYNTAYNREDGYLIYNTIFNGLNEIKNLHLSGSVIFNCKSTKYLNDIKNYLLEDYPLLKNNINVYITKNSTFNAFTTINNDIYINIGFLSRIQNEAQLAFVLSHEIMHIINKHIINQEIELDRINASYTLEDIEQNTTPKILTRHSISKIEEFESDLDGLKLYISKKYNPNDAINALKLINEISEIPMEKEKLILFAKHFNLIYDSLSFEKKQTEELIINESSTHPSISERVNRLIQYLEANNSLYNQKKKIEISTENFNILKQDALNLISECYVNESNYVSLFIISYTKYLENDFSEKNIFNLCYSIQSILNEHKYYNFTDNNTTFYNNFLSYLNFQNKYKWGINILKMLQNKHPENLIINDFYTSLIKNIYIKDIDFYNYNLKNELVINSDNITNFSDENFNFEIKTSFYLSKKERLKLNRYKKIKSIKGKIAILPYNNICLSYKKRQIQDRDPQYYDNQLNKYLEVYDMLENVHSNSVINLAPNDRNYLSEKYKLMSIFNFWIKERFEYQNQNYISYYKNEYYNNFDSLNIKYLMTGLNIEIKGFNEIQFIKTYFSIIAFPIYLPQNIFKIFINNKNKYIFTILFNIETGEIDFIDQRTYQESNTISQIYQNYNDVIYQINKN